MAWRNHIVLACRLCQIFFALVAFSLSMAIASGALRMYFYDYDFEPDSIPNGYLIGSAGFSLGITALLGAVGILADKRPGDIAQYLVVLFDIAAFMFSVAAGTCLSINATSYWGTWGDYICPVIFAFLCTLPLGGLILRSLLLMRKARPATSSFPKHQSDAWSYAAPEQGRPSYVDEQQIHMARLEARVEQLENETRTRPLSPDTSAHWSAASGAGTLAHHPSITSNETRAPAYSLNVPSRKPTGKESRG